MAVSIGVSVIVSNGSEVDEDGAIGVVTTGATDDNEELEVMDTERAIDVEEDAGSRVVDDKAASIEDDDGEEHDVDGHREKFDDMGVMLDLIEVSNSDLFEPFSMFRQCRIIVGLFWLSFTTRPGPRF